MNSLQPLSLCLLAALLGACSDSEASGSDLTRVDDGSGASTGAGSSTGLGNSPIIPGLEPDAPLTEESLTACGEDEHDANFTPPNLLVLLDRSGSMVENQVEGGSVSRWVEASTALSSALYETEQGINWGLKMYPDDDWCGVSEGANVPVGVGNAQAIIDAYTARPPIAGKTHTPTRAAVQQGLAYLQSVQDGAPRAMVLISDGEPNCMAPFDTDGIENDEDGTRDEQPPIDAVALANANGVPVYVVGFSISKEKTAAALNAIAEAGGKAKADPFKKYYTAENAEEFQTAMAEISVDAAACRFVLSEVPDNPDNVTLFLAAEGVEPIVIDEDPAGLDGWTYTDETTIEVYGPSCDMVLERRDLKMKAGFDCDPTIVR